MTNFDNSILPAHHITTCTAIRITILLLFDAPYFANHSPSFGCFQSRDVDNCEACHVVNSRDLPLCRRFVLRMTVRIKYHFFNLYVRVKFAHWSDLRLGISAFDTTLYPLVLTVLFHTGWWIGKRRMLNG